MIYRKHLFFILFLISLHPILAQEEEIERLKEDFQNYKENYELKISELDSLINEINKKLEEQKQEDELQKLIEEADRLKEKEKEEEADISKKFFSGVRMQQGLNPNISVGSDFFAGYSTSDADIITQPSDISYGNNGFYLRELEVAMIAPLDPFARGKAFLSFTQNSVSVEEVYVEWLNLPLNMTLKTGIFRAEFGLLNRYHDHALPQFDKPRALVNLFSNSYLGGTGASLSFLLPRLFSADASSLDIAVFNGGNDFSFAKGWNSGLTYVAHWKNYYDLSKNSYFEFRISGTMGKNSLSKEYNSYVGSCGLAYKWVPVGREKYRTLDWKTELLYSYREDSIENVRSLGFYSSIQNKLNARFWLNGRIGYSQLPYDSSQHEWDFTACLDFWQSEFVFTRLQYQYNLREINELKDYMVPLPSNHSVIIQIVWAMGPHKHEAY